MDLGPHATFIIAAYAVAALVIVGLIVWVLADHRAQRRLLADLEARGITRRSQRRAEPGAGSVEPGSVEPGSVEPA